MEVEDFGGNLRLILGGVVTLAGEFGEVTLEGGLYWMLMSALELQDREEVLLALSVVDWMMLSMGV